MRLNLWELAWFGCREWEAWPPGDSSVSAGVRFWAISMAVHLAAVNRGLASAQGSSRCDVGGAP